MGVAVGEAVAVARDWAETEGRRLPGFRGAYLAGSILDLPSDAPFPHDSDVDLKVVVDEPPPFQLGKFRYRGVLLEVSPLAREALGSAEAVLGQFHSAGAFRMPNVLLDPGGDLTALQAAVARDYPKRYWVRKRCEHVEEKLLSFLHALPSVEPFHEQVVVWLFGTSLTTHMPLMAGLVNATVRKRYVAARAVLEQYGHLDLYAEMLALLGCAGMERIRVEEHLDAVTTVFDTVKGILVTPYRFAADLSDAGRPVVVDGSRALIEAGYHREAVFWLLATYCRCRHVLHVDGTAELRDRFRPAFLHLLADLGIRSYPDLERRAAEVEAFLPRLWDVTEAILAANPAIEE